MEVDSGPGTSGSGNVQSNESPEDISTYSTSLVLEHLVQNCYKKTAIAFVSALPEHAPLDSHILEDMDQRASITRLLTEGRIMDAVEVADKLLARRAGKSRKEAVCTAFPALYFRLGCQHFVELVRERRPDIALQFAQQTLAEYGNNAENMDVLQDITVLLAYEDPDRSPNCGLLAKEKREVLATDLNHELYSFCNSRAPLSQSLSSNGASSASTLEEILRQLTVCGKLLVPPRTVEQMLTEHMVE